MRDRPDDVDPEVDGPPHQVLSPVERQNSLLRKGDELERHLVADLLAELDQGAHRAKLRVADVDVAPHELHAVGELPPKDRPNPLLDVLYSQRLNAIGPDGYAL